MEILWLKISDFKSFRGDHIIDFRQYEPGLYYMRGENQDEPDLGSNGAGKSTVWDALHWCWFGTSVRGTPSTQLVPWTENAKPSVEFAARIGGRTTRIIRTHKPNRLIIKRGRKVKQVTQDEVNDLLGLTPDTVQSSIIIGQFSNYFFDLKPRQKMNLLTELMNLDYWIECGKKASAVVAVLKEDSHGLEKKLAGSEASVKTLQGAVEVLEADLAKAGRKVAVKEIRKETRLLRADRATVAEQRKGLIKKQKIADEKIDDSITNAETLSERLDDLRDEEREISFGYKKAQEALEELRVKIRKLEQKKFGGEPYPCPECGQPITDAHRRKERRSLRTEIDKLRDETKKLGELLSKQSHKIDATKEVLKEEEALRKKYEGEYDSLGDRIRKLTAKINDIDASIEENEKEVETAKNETQWIRDKIEENRVQIADKEKRIKAIKEELQELETAIGQAAYWAKTFKDIRLFEINDILTSLEVEINSYLADLGMKNWSVKMEVERETRRGSISRGFRVMVDPGKDTKGGAKPWEAWSGGEGQRLRLAGTLALANLILRQYNRTSNFQVWDEKLYWLSGRGEDDMLELLQEVAVAEGKMIFIIDQHNLDFPFDGSIKIIKDHKGSHVVQ